MLLPLDKDITGDVINDSLINAYLYDFLCIKCKTIQSLSRSNQVVLFTKLLSVGTDKKITSLTEIHYRYWLLERIIDIYFELINSYPNCLNNITNYILNDMKEVSSDSHYHILVHIFTILEPWGSHWTDHDMNIKEYHSWIITINNISIHVESLFDLITDKELYKQAMNQWIRLKFFKSFVQELGIVLEINADNLVKSLSNFKDNIDLVTKDALKSLITILFKHSKYILTKNDDILSCPISRERFVDPVKTSDGFTYERKAITEWFQKSNLSPLTNEKLPNLDLVSDVAMIQMLNESQINLSSQFLEYFIFEIILDSKSHTDNTIISISGNNSISNVSSNSSISSLDLDLLKDLISISSGTCPDLDVIISTNSNIKIRTIMNYINIIMPSLSARYTILQEIIKKYCINQDIAQSIIGLKVNEYLKDELLKASKISLDQQFCVDYINIYENEFRLVKKSNSVDQNGPINQFSNINVLFLSNIYNNYNDNSSVVDTLQEIAKFRICINDMVSCFLFNISI